MENFTTELKNKTDNQDCDTQSLAVEVGDSQHNEINDDNTSNSNITIHWSKENNIVGIPIVECLVNYVKHQIIITEVNFNPKQVKFTKLYDNIKLRLEV